jgi:hypothetical chaperone protein
VSGLAVGVDFGTSNTAAALPGERPGAPARILEVDPRGDDARLLRSVLFFPRHGADRFVGGEAIARYLEDGEGRFLQSVKSFLPAASFAGTTVRNRRLALEDLVALLLAPLRERIEALAGGPVTRAVFGRPAVFHEDPARDRLAEERLRRAAVLAGFPEPIFLIEPIAAALRYEEQLARDEVVLVGDFGAGTSDFTLMRLGPGRGGAGLDRRGDVLASGGVRVGGDRFDAAVVERLLPHFGAGSTYQTLTKRIELPPWIVRTLLSWHELFLLREKSTLDFLEEAARTSDRPRELGNLLALVEENLAYHLYRSVEAAKRELSTRPRARVQFDAGGILIDEPVTRAQFDAWTAPLRRQLLDAVAAVLARAPGVVPDTVFLTGGTSYIPAVRDDFARLFGEGRLREGEGFTAVAAGLGRAAGQSAAR